MVTLTRGCRIPYPSVTRPSPASKWGRVSGWAMMPISFFAVFLGSGGPHRSVLGQLATGRVREVAENGEVDARIEVPECQHLQVIDQLGHGRDAGQERRHDHHGPGVFRDLGAELDARKSPRRNP